MATIIKFKEDKDIRVKITDAIRKWEIKRQKRFNDISDKKIKKLKDSGKLSAIKNRELVSLGLDKGIRYNLGEELFDKIYENACEKSDQYLIETNDVELVNWHYYKCFFKNLARYLVMKPFIKKENFKAI